MSSEENNEIVKLDFGAGDVVVLPSRCLRVAKNPTDCDICATACPASAIRAKPFVHESEGSGASVGSGASTGFDASPGSGASEGFDASAGSGASVGFDASAGFETPAGTEKPRPDPRKLLEKRMGVEISEDCIHCGLCITVCPVESLITTKHHVKNFEKQISDRAAMLEGLAVGCARALFGVSLRFASRAISFPCLAALSSEAWFLAATTARDAHPRALDFDRTETADERYIGNLKVFLPAMICDDCPVNLYGDAESTYLAAIAEAESWGANNIELVGEPEELSLTHAGKLMDSLNQTSSSDKREAVEQLAGSLLRSWQSAGDNLEFEKKRREYLAKKQKKTTAKPNRNPDAPRPFGKKSQRRTMLRAALEREETFISNVKLLCADTIIKRCTGCRVCVDACPLEARRKVESNSVLYFGKLPESKRSQEEMVAITDQLCCLGCSACVMQCPSKACVLTWLPGKKFMSLREN